MLKIVDNQLAQPKDIVQRSLILLVAILLAIFASILAVYLYQVSDPYTQEVLSLEGNAKKGYAIFKINCAGCHGIDADGHVGPSLQNVSKRKSKMSLIHQVTSGQTPPMPKFQPNPEEMSDLLSFLESL